MKMIKKLAAAALVGALVVGGAYGLSGLAVGKSVSETPALLAGPEPPIPSPPADYNV